MEFYNFIYSNETYARGIIYKPGVERMLDFSCIPGALLTMFTCGRI